MNTGGFIDIMTRGRVLLACPAFPDPPHVHPLAWQSIMGLEWDGRFDIVVLGGDQIAPRAKNSAITWKYNLARELALQGGYDALLCIEADMVVPPDTLARLWALGSDVAYGLYCMRHDDHPWSAVLELREWTCLPVNHYPQLARRLWGYQVDVTGVGQGCTLIRRRVLERLPFRAPPDKPFCCDWYLGLDCQTAGFTQRADLNLVCGHIDRDHIIWPDPAAPGQFRLEFIGRWRRLKALAGRLAGGR
ncbi:MAG: glycosyltransferase family 2 protein [Chloroflexi bacterium]|nr:glycosyltransferase family 2 protein [Chloroflexota bacterium]MBU1748841.1 glycosyltransferase family 2 protein [Chloroflexota bacterium]